MGTWLPEQVRKNDAWPPSFATRPDAVDDRTFNDIPQAADPIAAAILARDLALEARDPFLGATLRHVADPAMTSAEAEAQAGLRAMSDAGIAPADVDLVISNSIVPDRLGNFTPSQVAHLVGAQRALAFSIDAACASGVAALEMARAYLESGLARVALLTQGHLLMRAFPFLHPACPGLGDGAAALVVAAERRGLVVRATFGQTHGEFAHAVTFVRGTDEASDPPWWQAGGEYRIGSRAPALAKQLMRDTVSFGAATLRELADRVGIDVASIAVLASVQPRGFVPGAIAERLGLPRERAVTTYPEIAHVGNCGPVFNLKRARELGMLTPGAIVALYAQGAGFTRTAALLEVSG
jgi:3-oxoacyl-[acyl-carrier-protein] synthase-3